MFVLLFLRALTLSLVLLLLLIFVQTRMHAAFLAVSALELPPGSSGFPSQSPDASLQALQNACAATC